VGREGTPAPGFGLDRGRAATTMNRLRTATTTAMDSDEHQSRRLR
jgi:hypothetical protein